MTCNHTLQAEGKPYPRTCADCGLGPCKLTARKCECGGDAFEITRLRTIIGALVEWRGKPWVQKEVDMRGVPMGGSSADFDAALDKARSETEQVWQAAREAIKADQSK